LAAAAAPKAAATLTTTTKAILLGAIGIVAVGATVYLRKPPPTPETNAPVVASAPTAAPIPTEPAAPVVVASTAAPPAESVVVAPQPHVPAKVSAPAPAPSVDSLDAERALLSSAQQQLSARNYAEARKLYEKHLADFPTGALRVESNVGRVIAMCGSKDPGAEAEATKLLASPLPAALAKRVRTTCNIE
jgi:hypothetical protein